MSDTEDDIEQARQLKMMEWIRSAADAPLLMPLGRHSSFHVPRLSLSDGYYDARMCDAAWWSVATILGHIDHAWQFGPLDGPKEPWGFVTEPYIRESAAKWAIERAQMMTAGWGVTYAVLAPEFSSWNPGSTVPIIAYVEQGAWRSFIRSGLTWLLREGRPL